MKQFRTREGNVGAVDTKTQLTTVGSDTAPGPLLVPQGMKYVTGIIVAAIQNMSAATGFSGFIRLEGQGMVNGPESIAVVAGGNGVATGGNFVQKAIRIPINLPVSEGNEIQLFAEMAGTDVGTVQYGITLEFSDTAGTGPAEHKTLTLEGDIASADARTELLTQGSIASPSKIVPAGYTNIDKIFAAISSEGLAAGVQNWFIRVGGNSPKGGEQVLMIGSSGTILPQSGSDAAPQCTMAIILENLQIPVSPSDNIQVWCEGAGVDTGTGYAAVTLVFSK